MKSQGVALVVALLAATVAGAHAANTGNADLCAVYDPFRVLPDNNKFQIGGSFPLHEADCFKLRPDTVQEIVAMQWALTHWNQNPNNFNAKLGLYAGDTCSRTREALSQSLRFLDSVGYHEPVECRKDGPAAKLLGVISPKDYNSSLSLGRLLQLADVPIAAYAPASAHALLQLNVNNIVATTPTISVYTEVLTRVMAQLRSNLVTIVEDGSNPELVTRVINQLKTSDIYVSDVLPAEHPNLAQMIDDTDASIVLSILGKEQLQSVIAQKPIFSLEKLWISLPLDGEALDGDEQMNILPEGAQLELISIQPRFVELPQFRDYFLRVLKNNYKSYSLLKSYMQQVYGCTKDACDIDKDAMIEKYTQARTTEAAIRMTYAFAAAGAKLGSDPEKMKLCAHPDPACTSLILSELESLDYEFSVNDPSELAGASLHFYRGKDGVLLASGMVIDAIELAYDSEQGATVMYKLLEYHTGKRPAVVSASLRPADSRIRSICAPYRPFCGQCPNVATVSGEKHFLSIPRHYPLYLSALFDLHSGAACQNMKNTDISLPMAFVHTVWTFKQRFPQLSLLKNLDFGALLVDTCSSGKQAMETVVRSETQCFRFNQAGRNITIVPGSVFGYISALQGDSQQALKGYFASGDTDASLVAVDSDHSSMRDFFTALPSAKAQALALLRFLNRMQWQFVTVALSEQDTTSLSAFRQFERLALDRGVCLAEVINLSNMSPSHSMPSNTNVTVVFATAKDTAAYFNFLHQHEQLQKQVHILMGDAHDFALHDSDSSKYVGTVSLQPKDILYSDFREWIGTTTPLTLPEMWYWNYVEDRRQCALSQKSKIIYGKMCSGDEVIEVGGLGRMTRAGYLARGVERFLFAMDAVYKKYCPTQTGLCPEFYSNGRRAILEQLKRASVEDDIEVYEFMPNKDGKAVYHLIGNWSTQGGLKLSALYKSFGRNSPVTSRCQPPMCKCFLDGDFFQRPLDSFVVESMDSMESASYVKKQPAFGSDRVQYRSILEHLSAGEWRAHPHNFVLLAVITLLSIGAFAVLILVLVKLYLRVVKGNQSLGITLLVGIIILYISAYFFVFDATDSVCRSRVVLHGIGYTLCFGVMIAKATQLRNAETLGFSALHISFWNYWLLLFFIVGVQLALCVRWMAEPFMSTWSVSDAGNRMICSYGRNEFVMSNAYVIILLCLALFINSRNRNIKRNYKETKWLFSSAVACTLIWISWVSAYYVVPYEWKESVVALELISCATILLAFLFGPKIYILLSYEPVVVEYKPDGQGGKVPMELFERDEDLQAARAVSPASSTGSVPQSWSSRSQRGSGTASGPRSPRNPTTAQGPLSGSSSGNYSDDQSPIFHTVMRKKKAVRRSHSEHETRKNTVNNLPDLPVIRTSPIPREDQQRAQVSPRGLP